MMTTDRQKVISLAFVRNYVALICNTTVDNLMLGDYDADKIKSYEDYPHDCFIYAFNKFHYDSHRGKLIRKTKFQNILYGTDGTFNLEEALLYADFMFNTVKEKTEINKAEAYVILRPMLSYLLNVHKSENEVDKSFNVELYLDKVFGSEIAVRTALLSGTNALKVGNFKL